MPNGCCLCWCYVRLYVLLMNICLNVKRKRKRCATAQLKRNAKKTVNKYELYSTIDIFCFKLKLANSLMCLHTNLSWFSIVYADGFVRHAQDESYTWHKDISWKLLFRREESAIVELPQRKIKRRFIYFGQKGARVPVKKAYCYSIGRVGTSKSL